jgi:hypothetical protein
MFEANPRHPSAVIASDSGIELAEEASWRQGLLSDQDLECVAGGITRSSGEEIPQ